MINPLVSIVIPTYGRKKMVERLIKSIFLNTYKNFEIIIIDDASPDNTSQYLRHKFKNLRIYKNKINLFTAESRNLGQRRAKGEFILFIDDDNVIEKNMIKELVNVLISNPIAGEVGPVNYNFNKKDLVLLARSTRNMFTTKTNHLRSLSTFGSKKYWETDDIPNSFMVKASLVKENKIEFKKKYGIMYEESDYAYRIRKLGLKIYIVRAAKIYHDIEDLSGEKVKDYLYHFMVDKRRPFLFARNRIMFHFLYSNKLQNIGILCFWIWIFCAYYCYKFIFYKGYGNFNIKQKISAALSYIRGTISGLNFVFFSTHKI